MRAIRSSGPWHTEAEIESKSHNPIPTKAVTTLKEERRFLQSPNSRRGNNP